MTPSTGRLALMMLLGCHCSTEEAIVMDLALLAQMGQRIGVEVDEW